MSKRSLIGLLGILVLVAFVFGSMFYNLHGSTNNPSTESSLALEKRQSLEGLQVPEDTRAPGVLGSPQFVKGEVIVKYKGDKEARVVKLPKNTDVEAAVKEFKSCPDVVYV